MDFPLSTRWRALQVLMTIIFLHHALQPVGAWLGLFAWKAKFWVALGGGVIYGVSMCAMFARHRVGPWIAIVGPLIGTTVLSTGALLMALHVINFEFRQDLATVIGGIPQVLALPLAISVVRAPA